MHSEAEVRYKALKCDIEYLEKGSAAFEDAQRVAIGEQVQSLFFFNSHLMAIRGTPTLKLYLFSK